MNNKVIAELIGKTSRRKALKNMGLGALGFAALGMGSADAQVAINSTDSTSSFPLLSIPSADLAILDFALNLEYLEAQFYSYATTGAGIEAQGVSISGRGTEGIVTVPTTTQVPFVSPAVQQYAMEIAADEIAHVKFLRGIVLADGLKPVAQPAIDLVNSFNAAANAAGLGATFNPFASDLNFLLGAFIFEDVGVTAYHGALASFVDKSTMRDAAGIMGTEAYHASNIRTQLYGLGSAAQAAAQAISNARNSLGGEGLDQGIVVNGQAKIVPADSNAIVFARTSQQVLNIVYLAANAKSGGFFPNGINS